jgi:hypothetical protein
MAQDTRLAVHISNERRQELKIVAAVEHLTMQELVNHVLAEWLDGWSSTHPGVLDPVAVS